MKIAEKLKQRAGFTLVELCVVMAVVAIVGTMVVTFMIFMSNQQAQITKEAKCIEEITEVQKTVNGWLKKYDSTNYKITTSGNNGLVAINNTDNTEKSISFSNNKITADSIETEEFENITKVEFERTTYSSSDGGVTTVNAQIVKATITYENGKQTLIFPLFSNITRQRQVEGRER